MGLINKPEDIILAILSVHLRLQWKLLYFSILTNEAKAHE
jgi:hypothetical protein